MFTDPADVIARFTDAPAQWDAKYVLHEAREAETRVAVILAAVPGATFEAARDAEPRLTAWAAARVSR